MKTSLNGCTQPGQISTSLPALPAVTVGINVMKQALCMREANVKPTQTSASVRKKKNRARLMGSGHC